MKTILHRLFGAGRIPAAVRAQLEQEGGLVLDEGIRCSLRCANFRAPGKIRKGYWRGFTGAVALTKVRFMAFEYSRKIIDVPLADERIHKMRFAAEGASTLVVEFESSLFHKDWSGAMLFRFHTPHARVILQRLRE